MRRWCLKGGVEPGERLPEGPFGDHTGFYTPVEPFPVLHDRLHDDPEEAGLPDRSWSVEPPQEDGPIGQGDRADLPAAGEVADPRHRRHATCRSSRRVPQLRDRLHRQALPQARAEGDERDLGRRHAVARQADRGRRRRLRRARLLTRWPGGRSATSTTPTTWCNPSARSTISITRPTSSSGAARSASTRPRSCRPRATAAVGRR